MSWPSWTAASASCSCAGCGPFLSDKYDITQHPNYKYTADADPKNAFDIEGYLKARLKLKPNQICDVYEIDAAAGD